MLMTPQYNQTIFSSIWDSVEEFLDDCHASQMPITLTDTNLTTLYYLLYGRHGNDPIVNRDLNQWKYRLYSVIFQYGPTWEKRLELQGKIRSLTDDQLRQGAKVIHNNASNPQSTPTTATLEELEYINSQDTSNQKRSLMDAYGTQWELLDNDVTEEFLIRFDKLFLKVVMPQNPLLYSQEDIEDYD